MSARPGIKVVPTAAGIEAHVRYITRAYERHHPPRCLCEAVVEMIDARREALRA